MDRRESFIYDGAGLLADAAGSIHIAGPNGALNQAGWTDQMVLSFIDLDADGPNPSQLASRNLYGPAVDQIFATESASSNPLWSLTDHQGTPRDWADLNSSGTTTIAQHTRYTVFGAIDSITDATGNPLAATSSPLPSFTGQLYDADANLMYYRARWYDPQLGKFLNDDPMGFGAGDANVSRYVGNGVASRMDASGLDEHTPPSRDGNVLFLGDPAHVERVMKLWTEMKKRAEQNEKLQKELIKFTEGMHTITLTVVENSSQTLFGSYLNATIDVVDIEKLSEKNGPFMQQMELVLHEVAEQHYKLEHGYTKFDEKEFEKAHRYALKVEGMIDGWVRQWPEGIELVGPEVAGVQAQPFTHQYENENYLGYKFIATTGYNTSGRIFTHGPVESDAYKAFMKKNPQD